MKIIGEGTSAEGRLREIIAVTQRPPGSCRLYVSGSDSAVNADTELGLLLWALQDLRRPYPSHYLALTGISRHPYSSSWLGVRSRKIRHSWWWAGWAFTRSEAIAGLANLPIEHPPPHPSSRQVPGQALFPPANGTLCLRNPERNRVTSHSSNR